MANGLEGNGQRLSGAPPFLQRAAAVLRVAAVLLSAATVWAGDGDPPAWNSPRWPAGRVLGYTLEVRSHEEHGDVRRESLLDAHLRLRVGTEGDVSLVVDALALSRPGERLAWSFGPRGPAHDGSEHARALAALVGTAVPVILDSGQRATGLDLPPEAAAALEAAGFPAALLLDAFGAATRDAPPGQLAAGQRWTWSNEAPVPPRDGVPDAGLTLEARVLGTLEGVVSLALAATGDDWAGGGTLLWHAEGLPLGLQLEIEARAPAESGGGPTVSTRIGLELDRQASSGPGLEAVLARLPPTAPEILARLDAADVIATKAKLTNVQTVLATYRMEHGDLPESLELLLESDPANLGEPWLGAERLTDAWGRPFVYRRIDARSYALLSWGADGESGGQGADADITAAP